MFTNSNAKSWRDFFYIVVDATLPYMLFTAVTLWSIIGLWVVTQSTRSFDISIHVGEMQKKSTISEPKIVKVLPTPVRDDSKIKPKAVKAIDSTTFVKEEPVLEGEALYRSYISEIVETHYPDLDKDLIAAIVYHESRFLPEVVNKRTNATGLMQVLPKWHTERARKLGVTDLSDPYGNILVGCDILNEVYQQKHSMDYALDVYAGGYSYADSYRNSISPYRKELHEILQEHIV